MPWVGGDLSARQPQMTASLWQDTEPYFPPHTFFFLTAKRTSFYHGKKRAGVGVPSSASGSAGARGSAPGTPQRRARGALTFGGRAAPARPQQQEQEQQEHDRHRQHRQQLPPSLRRPVPKVRAAAAAAPQVGAEPCAGGAGRQHSGGGVRRGAGGLEAGRRAGGPAGGPAGSLPAAPTPRRAAPRSRRPYLKAAGGRCALRCRSAGERALPAKKRGRGEERGKKKIEGGGGGRRGGSLGS